MEKYFGFSLTTLISMQADLISQLAETTKESALYPTDNFLYDRQRRLLNELYDLLKEMEARNDEIIVRQDYGGMTGSERRE